MGLYLKRKNKINRGHDYLFCIIGLVFIRISFGKINLISSTTKSKNIDFEKNTFF